MTKTERAYFNAAKSVSKLSDYYPHKMGCVIVKNHHIISSGYNSGTKCDPIQAKLDMKKYGCNCLGFVHAELNALLPFIKTNNSDYNLYGAIAFIYREHKNGTFANARPCSSCEMMLKTMGIKKIYYTIENGYAVEKIQ